MPVFLDRFVLPVLAGLRALRAIGAGMTLLALAACNVSYETPSVWRGQGTYRDVNVCVYDGLRKRWSDPASAMHLSSAENEPGGIAFELAEAV